MNKAADHLDVVAGHDHLFLDVGGSLWPGKVDGDVSGTDEELWTVVLNERSVAST